MRDELRRLKQEWRRRMIKTNEDDEMTMERRRK